MTQYRVLASEGRQRNIYTKNPKNIKEKKKTSTYTRKRTGNIGNRIRKLCRHVLRVS
jgi:hypothetical protein